MLPKEVLEKWITKIIKLPYSSRGHKIIYSTNCNIINYNSNNNNNTINNNINYNNINLNFDIRIPKHELIKIQLTHLEKLAMIITGYKIEIEEHETMYCDYSY